MVDEKERTATTRQLADPPAEPTLEFPAVSTIIIMAQTLSPPFQINSLWLGRIPPPFPLRQQLQPPSDRNLSVLLFAFVPATPPRLW
jgi:hypothetical protein